jgi:hypothetical protein
MLPATSFLYGPSIILQQRGAMSPAFARFARMLGTAALMAVLAGAMM